MNALEKAIELADGHAHESWKRGRFMDLAIHKPSRDALHEQLKTMQNDAYTEGRKDQADEHMELLRWAYSKLHHVSFTKMEDALMLDRFKLLLEHGVSA